MRYKSKMRIMQIGDEDVTLRLLNAEKRTACWTITGILPSPSFIPVSLCLNHLPLLPKQHYFFWVHPEVSASEK